VFSVVNVRSVDDLTARARIRDAAVLRFGRDGFGASVRAVAEDAGVSPALVIHHFGSKAALREACDEHVLRVLHDAKSAALVDQSPAEVVASIATAEQYAPLFGYVQRSLTGGGALAVRFVDDLVRETVAYLEDGVRAGTVHPSRDPEGRARLLVTLMIGMFVSARIDAEAGRGPDPAQDAAATMRALYARTMLPGLELYTHGLFTDSAYLDAYLAYADQQEEP